MSEQGTQNLSSENCCDRGGAMSQEHCHSTLYSNKGARSQGKDRTDPKVWGAQIGGGLFQMLAQNLTLGGGGKLSELFKARFKNPTTL